jgi:Mg-chelatase subunit ChlD
MNIQVSDISVSNKSIKGLKIIGEPINVRNATHTVILLDTSGSMDDCGKLQNVKKSLNFLVKFLQKSDYLSLVTFNYMSNTIIDSMNVTSEYIDTFKYAIDTLSAEGGTNLSAGLLNVKSILERADPLQVSKTGLIILTDGHTNEGMTRSDDIMRIINSIKLVEPNISITTIGYGEDHNAQLLKDIGVYGGGSYNVVNSIEEVSTVFGDILGGLMTTVVQNLSIKYPSSWNCINMYTKNSSNNSTRIYIGDICAESETVILFENTDNSTVDIEGANTKDFSKIYTRVTWSPTEISNEKNPYYMAYFRNAIAYILQNITTMDKATISTEINSIKTYLTTSTLQFHPLTPILKENIQSIEKQLLSNSTVNTTANIQTSAFLGLGRGATMNATPRRLPRVALGTSAEDDMLDAMNALNVTTPFSNRIQQQFTNQMSLCASSDSDPVDNDT